MLWGWQRPQKSREDYLKDENIKVVLTKIQARSEVRTQPNVPNENSWEPGAFTLKGQIDLETGRPVINAALIDARIANARAAALAAVNNVRLAAVNNVRLAATAKAHLVVYEHLQTIAQEIVQRYFDLALQFGISPGRVEVWWFGGRLEGKPLSQRSDMDLIFRIENYDRLTFLEEARVEEFHTQLQAAMDEVSSKFKIKNIFELLLSKSKIL